MVSGYIASVQGHIIANKFLVLAKVRHSQRMNDSLISCWVITQREGTILFPHCLGCKAGLFTYSKCAILFGSVHKNKWQTCLHASEMLVDSTNLRQTSRI